MPKVSIQLLRGGLLLFNVAALTLLGFVFFGLLDDSPEGTKVRLYDPVDFELKEQAARPVPNQYRDIIRDLYLTPPPIRTAPVKPTTDPALPQLDSGPIGDWEIVGVIYSHEGQRFASIQEKGQTSVLNPGTRGRTINTSRIRGSTRASRGSSRSPTSRASSRSSGRTQISNQRVRYLEQGKSFRIDANTYMVVEIQNRPKQVIYEHNGRSYTLRQESKIDPVIHEEGRVLVLRGFSPEELELLTGRSLGAPGATSSSSIPTDVRGAIRGSDGKELQGTAATRARAGTPARVVNPTPASRTTPNPNARTRRGDIRDPRAERTGRKPAPSAPKLKSGGGSKSPGVRVTQTTIESTLGVDIEANPQEAIRRLEELNRAQQPNQPNQR